MEPVQPSASRLSGIIFLGSLRNLADSRAQLSNRVEGVQHLVIQVADPPPERFGPSALTQMLP